MVRGSLQRNIADPARLTGLGGREQNVRQDHGAAKPVEKVARGMKAGYCLREGLPRFINGPGSPGCESQETSRRTARQVVIRAPAFKGLSRIRRGTSCVSPGQGKRCAVGGNCRR